MEWQAFSALAAVCLVAGGVLRHLLDFVFTSGGKTRDWESNQALLIAQGAKLELLYAKFSDHVTDDARMFARLEAVVGENSRQQMAIENRITKAIEDLTHELKGITARVDRLLENR